MSDATTTPTPGPEDELVDDDDGVTQGEHVDLDELRRLADEAGYVLAPADEVEAPVDRDGPVDLGDLPPAQRPPAGFDADDFDQLQEQANRMTPAPVHDPDNDDAAATGDDPRAVAR